MTPHYTDDWLTVYHGDARAVMAEMEPESVHCVVTSPPYWGLRDYGTAAWEGGDPECDHLGPPKVTQAGFNERYTGRSPVATDKQSETRVPFKGTCGKCGAIRQDSQLGLEPTPEAYVESMVAVFREVRRVLRLDGTVWLNLGDSYYTSPAGNTTPSGISQNTAKRAGKLAEYNTQPKTFPGLKPKDLVGIPWRVAFALQADGWYLRSDIIWSKPNPMPESVTDRPTKSHEYLFLLSKSPRYYFDADAVREPHQASTLNRIEYGLTHRHPDNVGVGIPPVDTERMGERFANPNGRNMRSVWTIATAPYPGAHFATFPPKLVEPCIKAGTSERGVCPECGAPWVREIDRPKATLEDRRGPKHRDKEDDLLRRSSFHVAGWRKAEPDVSKTTGWRPGCGHGVKDSAWEHTVPATVLDPFAGSGTTGMVAQSLSRRAVLIDLSMDYLDQLMERNRDIPLGLETA